MAVLSWQCCLGGVDVDFAVDVDGEYTANDDNGTGIFLLLLVVGACRWGDGNDVEDFCDGDGDDSNGGGYAVGGGA